MSLKYEPSSVRALPGRLEWMVRSHELYDFFSSRHRCAQCAASFRTLGLMLKKKQSPDAGYVPVSACVGSSKNLKERGLSCDESAAVFQAP